MNALKHSRQRVDSSAGISAKRRGERSVVANLHQRGGAKIRLPRSTNTTLDAVLVNTAGGLTDNDRISWQCEAEPGAHLRITTGACEKLYRCAEEPAWQSSRVHVADGARVHWLPQECIVYDDARLVRKLDVSIEGDGEFLACESLVFGRKAMGETVRKAHISSDAAFGQLTSFTAMSTVVYCVSDDPTRLNHLAQRLQLSIAEAESDNPLTCHAGVSVLPGRLSIRLLATEAYTMRKRLVPVLHCLLGPGGLPRIWHT